MKNILKHLSDPSKAMLLENGVFGPRWVNDKPGPQITQDTFNHLLNKQYIKAINRVEKYGETWYAITQEGREAIKTMISFDLVQH